MSFKLGMFKAGDIFMWENDEILALTDPGAWCDVANDPIEGISARHGKGATIGNADGSAERILLSTFYMMAANKPVKCTGSYWEAAHNGQRLPNRLWCNPLRADGAW
jgi:hypothetical protein